MKPNSFTRLYLRDLCSLLNFLQQGESQKRKKKQIRKSVIPSDLKFSSFRSWNHISTPFTVLLFFKYHVLLCKFCSLHHVITVVNAFLFSDLNFILVFSQCCLHTIDLIFLDISFGPWKWNLYIKVYGILFFTSIPFFICIGFPFVLMSCTIINISLIKICFTWECEVVAIKMFFYFLEYIFFQNVLHLYFSCYVPFIHGFIFANSYCGFLLQGFLFTHLWTESLYLKLLLSQVSVDFLLPWALYESLLWNMS